MMDTDAEIVREAIRLFRPGLIEVRILHTQRGTQSGYFDEDDALINAVLPFDGAQNIYVTMNPVNSELLAVRRGQRRTRARPAPRGPPIRAVYVAYALAIRAILESLAASAEPVDRAPSATTLKPTTLTTQV
jgi:hypothetical protein